MTQDTMKLALLIGQINICQIISQIVKDHSLSKKERLEVISELCQKWVTKIMREMTPGRALD